MTDKKSILFTIPNFITAGSGRAMLNIIRRLDRARFMPAVCVIKKGGWLDHEVEEMGIPFLEVPFTITARPYYNLLRRAHRAASPFRPYRFDLWHSFHYLDDYTEPIIARMAGASAWIYTKKNMNWHRRAWYLRSLMATRIAAQNSDMVEQFFHTFPLRAKSSLVPRGVDAERFRPAVPARLRLREKFGVSGERTLVGCVAHLLPVKGQDILLEAVVDLPEAHVLLAGRPMDAAYVDRLHSIVRESGIGERVTFLDQVQDVAAFLAEIDLFVLPTRRRGEGCPVALLEAMASSSTCLATQVPGSRDLIEHGKNGWLVPPEDPVALGRAVAHLSQDLEFRRQLGAGARARVLQHYTLDHEVAAHEALYEAALS